MLPFAQQQQNYYTQFATKKQPASILLSKVTLSKSQSSKAILQTQTHTRGYRNQSQRNTSFRQRGNGQVTTRTAMFEEFQNLSPLWKAAGVGSLIGMGLVMAGGASESVSSNSNASTYPQYVTKRIASTYTYVASGLSITALTALCIARNPNAVAMLSRANPLVFGIASSAGCIGLYYLARNLHDNPIGQHAAWLAFNGLIGVTMFPLVFVGGNIVGQAAVGTAGVVGFMSLMAASCKSDAYMSMAGPLTVGLGVTFAASLGQMFFPSSALLYNLAVWGGLGVFSFKTLFDTQRMVAKAKVQRNYDAISNSMHIYMDVINIFQRLVMILSGNRSRK